MSEEQRKHLGGQLIQKEGVYKEELIGTARFCEVLAGLQKGDYYSFHPMATMNSEWVRNDGVHFIPAEVKVIAKAGGQKAKLLEAARIVSEVELESAKRVRERVEEISRVGDDGVINREHENCGNIWRHKDGGYYEITGVEDQRADGKIVYWYRGITESRDVSKKEYCREDTHLAATFRFIADSYEEWREMATSAVDEPEATGKHEEIEIINIEKECFVVEGDFVITEDVGWFATAEEARNIKAYVDSPYKVVKKGTQGWRKLYAARRGNYDMPISSHKALAILDGSFPQDEPDAACERVERTAIDETLAQRGSVYGSFEAQATCVGAIINDCIACAAQNGKPMVEDKALGCIAYIAVKLARFAVEPVGDTSHDLHGYAKLIDELFNGEVKNGR